MAARQVPTTARAAAAVSPSTRRWPRARRPVSTVALGRFRKTSTDDVSYPSMHVAQLNTDEVGGSKVRANGEKGDVRFTRAICGGNSGKRDTQSALSENRQNEFHELPLCFV